MSLQVYRKKRKFDVTPEPRGHAARRKGNAFVIQKHAARRLHYDFRLELDGVMKSWAITRGPSLVPGEKRLAVHTEDHPIEYNDFEGTIPQGEYGGGTVMIWDRGEWFPDGDPHKAYKKGHLDFTLEGEKLHGRWHLVRMHPRPGEKKEAWLLIKAKDDAARGAKDPDILEEEPQSVVTGRSLDEITAGKGRTRVWHSNRSAKDNVKAGAANGSSAGNARQARPAATARASRGAGAPAKKAQGAADDEGEARRGEPKPGRARLPEFVPPSLATLRAEPPTSAGWVHEVKFDGYRIQARLDRGEVRLLTRKGLDWAARFPNIAAAVKRLPATTALIDGEIVVEDENGVASFSGLQSALKNGERDSFVYYVFDLLHLDGRDLTGLPLIERKAELRRLLDRAKQTGEVIRYSEDFEDDGALVLRQACKMGLEGIVSKQRDCPYRAGRSDTFLKIKCANAQEFVVGGYVPSTVMPRAIGSLVVGYYQGDRLIYAGHVGTGYSQNTARELWKRLHAIEVASPPFAVMPAKERRRRDTKWVEPAIVVEAEFRGWTGDKLLRQAAFKGVREDKPAIEVVLEMPTAPNGNGRTNSAPPEQESPTAAKAAPVSKNKKAKSSKAVSNRSTVASNAAAAQRKPSTARGSDPARVKTSEVRFTHPDRVYWVDVGVTKQDLADYYTAAWDWMAPHLVGRPLALVRCPDGTKGQCFFQKHASAGLTERRLRTLIDKKGRQIIAVENLDGLLSLVQAGVLEVHTRGSLIDHLELCDRIVFDLDPGEGVPWSALIGAAREVSERLAKFELKSFVKLSGGKGLHVVVPIVGTDWETTKKFVAGFTNAMVADDPERYVGKMTKSLRPGKIFVDYFRNSLEQTSIAAYSTRARDGAPVSMPVTWQELGRTTGGNQNTVLNVTKRLSSLKQDPWHDIGRLKQKLPDVKALQRSNSKPS